MGLTEKKTFKPIGYISYTHGLDGKVKIVPMVSVKEFQEIVDSQNTNNKIFLKDTTITLKISIYAFTGKIFICKIDGYNDIEKAKMLLKQEIFIKNKKNDNYINAESLIGFTALTTKKTIYGQVIDFGDYGGGMLLEIKHKTTNKQGKIKYKKSFFQCDNKTIAEINYKTKTFILLKNEEEI